MKCSICNREKVPRATPWPDGDLTDAAKKEIYAQCIEVKCSIEKCEKMVAVCHSCWSITDVNSCKDHAKCKGGNELNIDHVRFCPGCNKISQHCSNRRCECKKIKKTKKTETPKCPECELALQGYEQLIGLLEAAETITTTAPTMVYAGCAASGDAHADAIKLTDALATQLQLVTTKIMEAAADQMTWCITMLEEEEAHQKNRETKPDKETQKSKKIKFLITHSGGTNYIAGQPRISHKANISEEDEKNQAEDAPSQYRTCAMEFMRTTRVEISKWLTAHEYFNEYNSITLPEVNPGFDRYNNLYIKTNDTEEVEELKTNPNAAEIEDKSRGYNWKITSYIKDDNNLHHAEMRAVRYAKTKGYSVVAMAPTKGCCKKCQTSLTDALLARIPEARRDQSEFTKTKKREREEATDTTETKKAPPKKKRKT